MKKYITTLSAILLICGLFWLGGFDFNARGEEAALCFIAGSFFGLIAFFITSPRK